MGKVTVLALRIVLALAFAGSLLVQAVLVPLLAVNLAEFAPGLVDAVGVASLVTLGLAATLAPGETVAPGIVLLVCGAAVIVAGIALLVLVLRTLLAQAVARDAEAHHLRAELDEVI